MPVFGANDLRSFCSMGVPVAFGGVSTYADGVTILGLFDRPIQNKLADQGYGGADVALPTVTLPFNAFTPMPRNKDAITVDGTAYKVSDTGAEDDGGMVTYELKLA